MMAKTSEEEFEDVIEVKSLIFEVDNLIENRDWEIDESDSCPNLLKGSPGDRC
jgi:hypothetical protein